MRLDGAGWRRYSPTIGIPSPRLHVKQLFQLPGRRLPWVSELNIKMQGRFLRHLLPGPGSRPLFWVQGGIDERLAAQVPHIDVFSVFDDPYPPHPNGRTLSQGAK